MQNIMLFVFGAVMGSTANALIDRLPKNESWFKGRSHCDKCGHELSAGDLIPIWSYISLRGKCRYCHKTIPYRNLLVEIVMGVAAFFIFHFSFSFQSAIIYFSIFWITLIITVMDWETQMVSEALIVLWGILAIVTQWHTLNLSGILVGLIIIGGIWAVTRGRAMGFGDVEIAVVMGLSLGMAKMLVALWLAFVLGAIAGTLVVFLKKLKLESTIAFGPFLVLGYWLALTSGDMLLKYFLGYV